MKEVIRINHRDWTVQNQIINHWCWSGEVINTCWGSIAEVQKDCLKYKDREDIQFYITKLKRDFKPGYMYIARILKGYTNEYGRFYKGAKHKYVKPVEEYENTAADDYLDYLSEQW